jgi:hypothetical protein
MARKLYHMDCACCGGLAGKHEQWFNQDLEYGVCTKCAIWIASREGWNNVFDCYGIPGRNWTPPTDLDFDGYEPEEVSMKSFAEEFEKRYKQPYKGKDFNADQKV